jgi:hypothetical protein
VEATWGTYSEFSSFRVSHSHTKMLSQFLRKKKIDVEHLLHSEWNRRLGLFSLCGISGIFMLTTAYFIVLPNLLALRLYSIPFIPYLYAVVLLILAGQFLLANIFYRKFFEAFQDLSLEMAYFSTLLMPRTVSYWLSVSYGVNYLIFCYT